MHNENYHRNTKKRVKYTWNQVNFKKKKAVCLIKKRERESIWEYLIVGVLAGFISGLVQKDLQVVIQTDFCVFASQEA